MARAITVGELASLRADEQWSRLYLAIHNPATVYSARINQVFTNYDAITELVYDGGSGTLADVLPGMTLYVGSAAGGYDKGMARIRKAPGASTFYIGETSDIVFADNDYLTVVDDFDLWARHPAADTNGALLMDNDLVYTDQHTNCDPVPVLGPDAALWLADGTAAFAPDAGESWVVGSTITGYAWEAPGALSISDEDTATPTITYDAAGTFRVGCTATAANGKSMTGYRSVFVFDADHPPVTVFDLERCEGNFDSGGWSFDVRMRAEADLSTVRDRAKVVLFARDFYDQAEEEIGPLAGYENVICSGRILGETIEWDADDGSVTFRVAGPQAWLNAIPSFPVGLKDTDGTPTTWQFFNTLTVDKAVWHLLHWQSTATMVMDIYPSGDARRAEALEGPIGSLWQQLEAIAAESIFASPLCDRYGRLFVEVDPQYTPVDERGSIPVVMTLLETDWQDKVDIERISTRPVGMVDLSGMTYDGTSSTPLLARAPGRVFKRLGSISTRDRVLLTDQAQANAIAGLILGQANNPFPRLSFDLAMNNRMIDIAPAQYCAVDIAAEDTLRGFVCANKRLIPRVVAIEHNADSGALLTSIDFEGENEQLPAVTIERGTPFMPNEPEQPDLPDFPLFPPPYLPPPGGWPPYIPPPPPPTEAGCLTDVEWPATGPFSMLQPGTISSADAQPFAKKVYPEGVYVRSAAATNKTKIELIGCFEKFENDAWVPDLTTDWISVEAWDAGGVIATATAAEVTDDGCGTRTFTFSPPNYLWANQFVINLFGEFTPPFDVTWDGESMAGGFHDGGAARDGEWDEWTWNPGTWQGTGKWYVPNNYIWNNYSRRMVLQTELPGGLKDIVVQSYPGANPMPNSDYVCIGGEPMPIRTTVGYDFTFEYDGDLITGMGTAWVEQDGTFEIGYPGYYQARWGDTTYGHCSPIVLMWGFRIIEFNGFSFVQNAKRIRLERALLYNIC